MPTLQISPGSINFGQVVTGSTPIIQLTLTNSDPNTPINVSVATTDNPVFTIVNAAFPFNPPPFQLQFGTHFLRIQYTAGTPEVDTGNLTISSDADNNPVIIPLTGQAIASGAGISINPSSYIFPNTRINSTSSPVLFLVTNTGSINVTIQIPVINGPFVGLGLPGGPTTLTPGNALGFNVEFSPTQVGYVVQSNGIVITSDAPTSPNQIDLEGLGIPINAAFIAVGGVENAFFAVGPYVRQFQANNFSCEEQTYMEKLLLLSGPGYEDCILRVELQYFDLGVADITIIATNERGTVSSQQHLIGTPQASGKVLHTLFDLKVSGELITLGLTTVGSLALVSIVPRYEPAGEIKR